MWIVGSRATMLYYNELRTAGAQVRKVLLAERGREMGRRRRDAQDRAGRRDQSGQRPAPELRRDRGVRQDPLAAAGGRRRRSSRPKKDWRLIGKGVPRRDTPAKVNGTALYGIDVRLPGMVYATTLHSPVHNAAPESWNDADIKKMPGVIATVKLPNGVAVVADRFERALAARNALKVTWQKGKAAGFNSEQALEKDYVKIHHDPNAKVDPVRHQGRRQGGLRQRRQDLQGRVQSDFGYHAQMEPLNAVARVNDAGDKVEIWEGTPGARRVAHGGGQGARLQGGAGRPTTSATWAAASAGATAATRPSRPR